MWRDFPIIINLIRLAAAFATAFFLLAAIPNYYAAIWVVLIAAGMDFSDGRIAKWLKARTNTASPILGTLADRLLIYIPLILLLPQAIIPTWVVLALLMRDFCFDAMRHWCTAEKQELPKVLSSRFAGGLAVLLVFGMMLHMAEPLDIRWAQAIESIWPLAVAFSWWSFLRTLSKLI